MSGEGTRGLFVSRWRWRNHDQMMRLNGFSKTVYERRPRSTCVSIQHRYMVHGTRTGDTGAFGQNVVCGACFTPNSAADGSAYSFFWDLFEVTKDLALVQVIYLSNGSKLDGLPHDLFGEAPETFQANVKSVVDRDGAQIKLGSVNKQKWRLAVLRSGESADRRALWIDYDSGGGHGHFDGMNIGLFAKGLDLFPTFGYPPVRLRRLGAPRDVVHGTPRRTRPSS